MKRLFAAVMLIAVCHAHMCRSDTIDHPEKRFISIEAIGDGIEIWLASNHDLAPGDGSIEANLYAEWGAGTPHPSFHLTTRGRNRLLYVYMEHTGGSEYNWTDVVAWKQGTTLSPPPLYPRR